MIATHVLLTGQSQICSSLRQIPAFMLVFISYDPSLGSVFAIRAVQCTRPTYCCIVHKRVMSLATCDGSNTPYSLEADSKSTQRDVFWRSTFQEYAVHFNAHTFVDHKWKCYESHVLHTAMFFVLFLCISCSALAGLMDILLYRECCKVAMHALIKSFEGLAPCNLQVVAVRSF